MIRADDGRKTDGLDLINHLARTFGHEEIWRRVGEMSLGQREVFQRVIQKPFYQCAMRRLWVFKEGVTIDDMGHIDVPAQAPVAYKEVKGFGEF